jgi:cation:H+ antiporter
MDELLLALAFAIVLAGALLFTNAVEWLGHSLGLGEGAVGSILAAVGTAAPETLIAIVALLDTDPKSEDVAIGAIVGAPFLLGTLAMGLVGLFAYLYRGRRRQGVNLDAHAPTLERDLVFFLIFFGIAGALAWGPPAPLRVVAGIAFLLAYAVYVRRTLKASGEVQGEETLKPLIFDRSSGDRRDPPLWLCVLQLLVGLGAMIFGAHLFVEHLLGIADALGADPLVLALILAPLATELPEKVNSFFWVREGKDALALGNIAFVSVVLGFAGGLLAYESLHRNGRFTLPAVIGWFALYIAFIIIVVL